MQKDKETEDVKREIKATISTLNTIRGKLETRRAWMQNKAKRFDTMRDMTPTDEAEADLLEEMDEYIGSQIDAIDRAQIFLESILK